MTHQMYLEALRCAECYMDEESKVHIPADQCIANCANPNEHHEYIRPTICFACQQRLPETP